METDSLLFFLLMRDQKINNKNNEKRQTVFKLDQWNCASEIWAFVLSWTVCTVKTRPCPYSALPLTLSTLNLTAATAATTRWPSFHQIHRLPILLQQNSTPLQINTGISKWLHHNQVKQIGIRAFQNKSAKRQKWIVNEMNLARWKSTELKSQCRNMSNRNTFEFMSITLLNFLHNQINPFIFFPAKQDPKYWSTITNRLNDVLHQMYRRCI